MRSGPHRGAIYRPWHPHQNPTPLVPLQPYELSVEVFPVGHVFRPGHSLVLSVHAPSAADPISPYVWEPEQPPAVDTILQQPGMRSSILLPVLPLVPGLAPQPPRCGELAGQPCWAG